MPLRHRSPLQAGEIFALSLVAASIGICLWVTIDDVRLYLWSMPRGAGIDWRDLVGGTLLICGPDLVALWLSLRRRPAAAACFAVLGLLMAAASWVGMRS